MLLLAPVAGAVADRLPCAWVMVAADMWRMSLAAMPPLVSHHRAGVCAIAFGLSGGTVFFSPAAAAALPGIVGEDQLIAANSGLWTAAVISQIAIAPLAGAIAAAWGAAPAFYFNAATFACSAVTLARLRLPKALPPAATRLLRLLAVVQLLLACAAGLAGLAATAAGPPSRPASNACR